MLEFIPHTGVSAVLHKLDRADTYGHRFSGHIHRGSGTHGDTMHHHRIGFKMLHPFQDIMTLFPSHTDPFTITQSVGMQIGHQHIIP